MSFSVVPLMDLWLPDGIKIPFGTDLSFEQIPQSLLDDPVIKDSSTFNRYGLSQCKYAFVAHYSAQSGDAADPDWKGEERRSIHDARLESAIFANLALWVIRPSQARFASDFHASATGLIRHAGYQNPLFCHPEDAQNRLTEDQVKEAAQLYVLLRAVPRKNSLWTALRLFWVGLTTYNEDIRYPFFWIALEALFGPEGNTGEIGYRLGQRIAFFISDAPEDARNMFRVVKDCYEMRSKILHGRWNNTKEIGDASKHTEDITRRVIKGLFRAPEMTSTFCSKDRDSFLQDWVFSRATEPPPYPKP